MRIRTFSYFSVLCATISIPQCVPSNRSFRPLVGIPSELPAIAAVSNRDPWAFAAVAPTSSSLHEITLTLRAASIAFAENIYNVSRFDRTPARGTGETEAGARELIKRRGNTASSVRGDVDNLFRWNLKPC